MTSTTIAVPALTSADRASVVIEIAVYEAVDAEAFAPRQPELHETLQRRGGMLGSLARRGVEEPTLFADIVVWRDLGAAQAAAEVVETDPQFAWLRASLGAMRFFGHFSPLGDLDALEQLAAAPLLEVAISRPVRVGAHAEAHRRLHGKLAGSVGVGGNLALSHDGGAITADLIGWADDAAQKATGATMMADAELRDFFDPTTEQILLALFTETVR